MEGAIDLEWNDCGLVVKVVAVRKRDLKKAYGVICRRIGLMPGGSYKLEGETLGAVVQLYCESWLFPGDGKPERRFFRCDKRYAAIVLLACDRLTEEIVAHESVHAGLALLRRAKMSMDASVVEMADEEAVAYPAGWMTSQTLLWAREEGWL